MNSPTHCPYLLNVTVETETDKKANFDVNFYLQFVNKLEDGVGIEHSLSSSTLGSSSFDVGAGAGAGAGTNSAFIQVAASGTGNWLMGSASWDSFSTRFRSCFSMILVDNMTFVLILSKLALLHLQNHTLIRIRI